MSPCSSWPSCVAARWVLSDKPGEVTRFAESNRMTLAHDRDGALVFLPESEWMMRKVMEDWPGITFSTFRERD